MKKIEKLVIVIILLAVLLFVSFGSISVKAKTLSGFSSFAEQRLKRDQILISSLNLPKGVKYKISKLDGSTVAIYFDFPSTYNQDLIINTISKVQIAIARDKSKNIDTDSATTPNALPSSTTTYYFSGSQYFTGIYNETIYNSTVGQLTSTKYPAWYRLVVTGTSAGVISNPSSHYSGFRLDTTVHIWGIIVGGSVSGSGFSVSITPGTVAEFHNQWYIQAPHRWVVLDWGQLIAYANAAFKLGVDNTVWVNNSGLIDPYHIYVPRWLYEY